MRSSVFALTLTACAAPMSRPHETPRVEIEPTGSEVVLEPEDDPIEAKRSKPRAHRPGHPYWATYTMHTAEDDARAKATPSEVSTARGLFRDATRRYEEGKYVAALEHYIRVYELVPHAAVAYKIGRCLEQLGRASDAIDAYEWFISSPQTHSEQAADARDRVHKLQATGVP